MQIDKVFSSVASSLRSAQVAHRTSSRLKAYRRDPTYSRLYGFTLQPDGTVQVVAAEAEVIRFVIESLAEGRPIAEVKAELDARHLRTRAQKSFSVGQLLHLVRPIFAGVVRGRLGTYQKSSVYPAIVPLETVRKAQKAVQKQVENAPRMPASHVEGGRGDSGVSEAVLGVGEALEARFSEDLF
jgi:hypothetical protein